MEKFILKDGVSVNDVSGVESCYSQINGETLVCSVSAEKLRGLAESAVKALRKPLFFFAEVPCTEDEENALGGGLHKNVYYLDNCTEEVCLAIVKRYGNLLFSDGLLEFGFGSHADNSEIYFRKYQTVQIYSPDTKPFEALLEKNGIKRVSEVRTLWDVLSEENFGECVCVEADGETIYDMIEILSGAGLYKSHTAEDN